MLRAQLCKDFLPPDNTSSRVIDSALQFSSARKKIRLDVDLSDSDDDFDNWFFESIPDKLGLRPRSIWMHPMNQRRLKDGEYVRVCLPYRQYPDKFFKYFRMSVITFDYILDNIREDISKHSNRPSISAGERLAITLRYLSTGMSYVAVASSFMVDSFTVGLIVRETCEAIYHRLRSKHMAIPSKDDLKTMAEDYERLWQFPNCCGAIDGKHIRIKCPARSGSMFFNYKHFYSIVLQAVSDSHYRFTFIDVGAFGKQSDGGIFDASLLSKFIADTTNLPPDRFIPGINLKLPYLFVCDDAYPLKKNMMKPYSGGKLTTEQDIFNGRLSRARRCVECAFGILVNKWRLLTKAIETHENTAESIVKCATILHNVVIDKEGIEEKLMEAVLRVVEHRESQNSSLQTGRRFNRKSASALTVRDCWKDYFNSALGSVHWQNRYVKQ